MARKHHHPGRTRRFIDACTSGLTGDDRRRVFTRDAPQASRDFSRGLDEKAIAALPLHKRAALRARLRFWAFTLTLSPARRAIYGAGLLLALIGFLQLFEQSTDTAHETWLQPRETVVLYSDGVTEAEDHRGQPFEETGLVQVFQAHAGASPRDLAHAVVRRVEAHAQEASLAGDVTLLVLKRKA